MKYELKREYTGRNESSIITPTCSCGWRGTGFAAWNDFQHEMVKQQENDHRMKGCHQAGFVKYGKAPTGIEQIKRRGYITLEIGRHSSYGGIDH